MTKRAIRLKEYLPGSEQWCVPSENYHASTDGSLENGPFRCRSDENGFIQTGNSVNTTDTPVVFLGDSFVESLYAHESDRFVSSTERMLIAAGNRVRFLNGGYSGSTSLQLMNVIINKIYPLVGPGGFVVLFPPHSDRDYLYKQGSYWSDTARGTTITPAGKPAHSEIPRGIKSAELVLKMLISTARQLELNLILATTPYREGDYGTDPIFEARYHGRPDWFKQGMMRRRQFTELIRDLSSEFHLPIADVQGLLSGSTEYFYDELHLSPSGHDKVSQYLAEKLPSLII